MRSTTDTTPGDIDTAKYQGNRSRIRLRRDRGRPGHRHPCDRGCARRHGPAAQHRAAPVRRRRRAQHHRRHAWQRRRSTARPQDDLILGLGGNDTLNGGAGNDILVGGANGASASGTFIDNFDGAASYTDNNGTLDFDGRLGSKSGDDNGDTARPAATSDIDDGNSTCASGGDNDIDGGETIARAANLTGCHHGHASASTWRRRRSSTAARPSRVQFAFNGTTCDHARRRSAAIGHDNFTTALTAARSRATRRHPLRRQRHHTTAGDELRRIDNLRRSHFVARWRRSTAALATTPTRSALATATTSSTKLGQRRQRRIASRSCADHRIDPVTGLPVMTLTGLNASDSNTGTQNGNLVINYMQLAQQTITVAGHFTGTNAQTGVERINFNGATFDGYLLGADDYLISRLDPANRDAAASISRPRSQQLHCRRARRQRRDHRRQRQRPDLRRHRRQRAHRRRRRRPAGRRLRRPATTTSSTAASTPTRWSAWRGNDTYIVDDLADVVVEAAGAGTDTVADRDGRALDRAHGQRREPHLHRHRRRPVRRHRQRAQQRDHRRRPQRHAERPCRQRHAEWRPRRRHAERRRRQRRR